MVTKTCPVCGAQNDEEEFFCKSCGYDFVTGSLPRNVDKAVLNIADHKPNETKTAGIQPKYQDETGRNSENESRQPVKWVAEIWVDPQWYRIQESPDQLPSPGQANVVGLRQQKIIIGRPSSAEPNPTLNCVTDSGVSRRHAQLITDGIRWWIEDLDSANGTFIGQVDQPLPSQPITGRVEISADDRIYIGSWTRIVVRRALRQEENL